MKRSASFETIAIACMLAMAFATALSAQTAPAKPSRFKAKLAAHEAADAKKPPVKGAIVAVGSASMAGWKSANGDDLSPLTIHPRGIGGSTMEDAIVFAKRFAIPHAPRAIILQKGDNDVAGKRPAQTILITAINDWRNRWIGDEELPPDVETETPAFGGKTARSPVKFPDWAKRGGKSPTGRILFATYMPWQKDDPLETSGLLGPVTVRGAEPREVR